MKIRDLIKGNPGHRQVMLVTAGATVADALEIMSKQSASAVVVMNGTTAEGIFTARDLVRCHREFSGQSFEKIPVQAVMSRDLVTAGPEEDIAAALAMMVEKKIRHLPVVRDKEIWRLLVLEDLVRAHVKALTREQEMLKDYIKDLQDAAHD